MVFGFLIVKILVALLMLGFDIRSLFTMSFLSSFRIEEGVVFRLNLIVKFMLGVADDGLLAVNVTPVLSLNNPNVLVTPSA